MKILGWTLFFITLTALFAENCGIVYYLYRADMQTIGSYLQNHEKYKDRLDQLEKDLKALKDKPDAALTQ